MAKFTLGLDVGAQSIGWMLIDEQNEQIVAGGVRIFPEGVDRDQQGGEKSKNQARREARGLRRQIARRKRRKAVLRSALYSAGLAPEGAIHFGDQRWVRRWVAQGRLPEAALTPADSLQRREFDQLNPYAFRARALTERLEPHEIGRVILHLAQRRGFLSNRKTDNQRDDTKGMLAEMGRLDTELAESQHKTYGQHFAALLVTSSPHEMTGDDLQDERHWVRGRHTRRERYIEEFDAIWNAQRVHHPELLTDKLKYGAAGVQVFPARPDDCIKGETSLEKYGVFGLVYFQRKMRWPKSVIGRCELERGEKRCPRADRFAQRFRILLDVVNLKYVDRASRLQRGLDDDQRKTVVELLLSTKEQTFAGIKKKLGLPEATRFNLERGERDKLKGDETEAVLKSSKGVGKRWKNLDDSTKDAVVKILVEEDQERDAVRRLVDDCGLTHEEATHAVSVNLPDGYMNFSRKAIEKLIPHLERGLLLMANDASDSALHAAGYLRPDERTLRRRSELPPPPDLPNPIVRQALVEVRRVVNAVMREHVQRNGRNELGVIRIELARAAKQSFEDRQRDLRNNVKNRIRRDAARDAIEKLGHQGTRNTINRYLLWQEQENKCLYCGQPISLAQLFNGDADVDHILPRWRSLDDSMANKAVCHRMCNHDKGDRTPAEWLKAHPERWQAMLQVASLLPESKQAKLLLEDIELDDFVARQLTDTAYISRCVRQYLEQLGVPVVAVKGQLTADLRHWWGLNNILDPTGMGKKNREDHRHHSIDALVIGMMEEQRLHNVANCRGENVRPPWPELWNQARTIINGMVVSHRVQTGVRGALHEQTFYGATQKCAEAPPQSERPWAKDWVEDPQIFVRRKALTDLNNTKQLEKVRDPAIRQILRTHLEQQGIDPDRPQKIPREAFKGANTPRMPSGVPILKVRMLEEGETFRPVSPRRSFQYVKPGSNHHIVYRAKGEGDNERWSADVLVMWDAADRGRQEQPLVDRSDNAQGRFVMSLTMGEMFEMDGPNGGKIVCAVRKIDQRSRRVYYKLHNDARQAKEINEENLYLSPDAFRRRRPQKVTVDAIGRIRRAGN